MRPLRYALLALMALATPATARDSLGMFGQWGAFRDPDVPRCYAIAQAQPGHGKRDYPAYADIGTWPARAIRGQFHLRLSHRLAPNGPITLSLAGVRYKLTGGGGDAWAQDARMDAAIIAALRSAPGMTVSARDASGHPFADSYPLPGVASAMDAAALGCAATR